jgi:hypothetical protein
VANESAWNLGAQIARDNIADRRARKRELTDEERKFRVTDLYDKGSQLSKVIPLLTGPDRDKAMTALVAVEEQIAQTYHPDHAAPGALQKDWGWLRGLFGRKQPQAAQISTTIEPGLPSTNIKLPDSAVTLPEQTYSVSGPSGATTSSTTPDITLPAIDRSVTMPAAPATRQTTFTPATREQRQQMARRDAARQKAQIDVAAAGLSPEEEQQVVSRKNLAFITQSVKDFKAANPDATPEQQTEFFNDIVAKTYGFPQQRPVWKEYQSPDGTKQWFDASRPDLIPNGWQAMAPGAAARGGGSDFWKTVIAKYGASPTAAQIEAERQHWVALGARGSETQTVTDAAGNTHTVRVPTFTTGQQAPAGLIAPDTAAGTVDVGPPQDWARDYQVPADIPSPIAPVRPSQQQGAGATPAGDGSAPAQAISTPLAVTPVTPAVEARLEPLGITPPSDPVIVAPDNPADAQAALREADRLGIGGDVRAVAEYRMDPNKATSGRGKQKFLNLVQRVNPAYDATKWEAVQQARHSFTAGGLDAKIMNSLGLGVNHLNRLIESYDTLENTEFPDMNKVRNASRVRTGYGGIASVDSAANAVAGEMSTVFKNSGATDTEIQSWRQQFDHNMSPDAFGQSVATMTDLMAGRMLNQAQLFVNTFGSLKGFPLLAPRTVEILGTIDSDGARLILEVNREAMESSGIKPPAPGRPTTAASPAGSPSASSGSSSGITAGAATITLSHAMEIYKQQHPGEKNVTKQMVINDLKKYGQSYVDDLK